MNTTSALFNLMPDSGSASAVGKRLNASRAGAVASGQSGPSGPSRPSSPFDALLKQAEAQAPVSFDSETAALKGGDQEAEQVRGRLSGKDVDASEAEDDAVDGVTLSSTADAWMPQAWAPKDDLTPSFAASNFGSLASSTAAPSGDAANIMASVDAMPNTKPSRGAQQGPGLESRAIDEGLMGSEPTRFMAVGTSQGPASTKADRPSTRESDSIRAMNVAPRQLEGYLEGVTLTPNEQVRAGLTLDDETTGDALPQASANEGDPLAQQRFSESISAPLQSAALEPAASGKPDVLGSRPSPLGAASSEAVLKPASRETAPSPLATRGSPASPLPRANAAADSRKARAGEAATSGPESLQALQAFQEGGAYTAEEQRAGLNRAAATTATSVLAQPTSPLQPPTIPQPLAMPSPGGSINFSQVMDQAHAAPEGYTAARLDTPLTDEAFPRVLGLQVGRWTDDGVQQVWLDVHPADMGPVAIQIALDGRQAELNFGAESAAARQVIEASLPDLASALQAAGLTLSGGSISQEMPQSRPGQDGAMEPGARGGTASASAGSDAQTLAPTRPARTRGLVDLYA